MRTCALLMALITFVAFGFACGGATAEGGGPVPGSGSSSTASPDAGH